MFYILQYLINANVPNHMLNSSWNNVSGTWRMKKS